MAKTTAKKPKNTGWGIVDHSRIKSNSMNLVHYSFKYTNSNLKGGIRVNATDAISGRFVAGLTYINKNALPLEHIDKVGANNTSGLINYLEHLQSDDPDNPHLQQIYEATSSKMEVMTDDLGGVNCRLPQVLIPNSEGYVSLTPLCAASFPHVIATRIKELDLRVSRVRIEQGGTQPANAGRWASKYQTLALLCSAPKENPETQHAYSIYHKGISIAPSYSTVYSYYTWLMSVRIDETISLSSSKDIEIKHLNCIVKDILLRGYNAHRILNDVFESCEISPNIKNYDIVAGVIDSSIRDAEWKTKFADFTANAICNYKLKIDGQSQAVMIDYVSEQGLSSLIRSML